MEPNRNEPKSSDQLDAVNHGLRQLLKQGRVASSAVLACPDLTQSALGTEAESRDDSSAATAVTEAILTALEHVPEPAVSKALLGVQQDLESKTLGERRRAAAKLARVTPESFRVRRESRLLDELARALLIELFRTGRSAAADTPNSSREAQVLLLYSHANVTEARAIRESLEDAAIEVTESTPDLSPHLSKSLGDSIGDHDAVVHLISTAFLRSRSCMENLLPLIKDDRQRNRYRLRTIPILLIDEFDLVNPRDQLELVDYWMNANAELEEQINSRSEKLGPALDEVRSDLAVLRDIAEHLMRFVRTATENIYSTSYDAQEKKGFVDVLTCIDEIVAEATLHLDGHSVELSHRAAAQHRDSYPLDRDGELGHSGQSNGEPPPEVEQLVGLHDGIVVASESDPEQPEFPPFSPRFPATPTCTIDVPQMHRKILLKDESHNFTGSHKDRMAWEIVVFYKSLIQDLLSPHARSRELPSASIISNGSAALAIQVMLRCYGLPALKVLIDSRADKRIVKKLMRVGCEVFVYDLAKRELDTSEVLRLTENENGFDVTSRNLVDPTRRTYYDWLAYEILNCGAKHIFIPVGTGDLYVNVLTVLRDELMGVTNDRRLAGGIQTIKGLTIYGATSSDPKTRMDKLYAPYRPTLQEASRVVEEMREQGLCGDASGIFDVTETIVAEALAVGRSNGIRCDESGIAGLSLLLQLGKEERFDTDGDVLVVNTGLLSL